MAYRSFVVFKRSGGQMIHESEVGAVDTIWGFKAQMEKIMGSTAIPNTGRTKYGKRLVGEKRKEVALDCKKMHNEGNAYSYIALKYNISATTVKDLIKEVK